jgi:phosphonate transport system substrate-binding protein
MERSPPRVWLLVLSLGTALACSREPRPAGPRFSEEAPGGTVPVYVLAVHPLHNPAKLVAAYQPLVDLLNASLRDARVVLEASRDYPAFEAKYEARKPELLLPNPWQTLQAMHHGYRVVAMAGDPEDFRGIFVVRKDGPVRRPGDLRGRAVSYPAPTALAACVMPQWFLHRHGLDVNRDIDNRYVGSQESSILNTYLRTTAAAATWPPPWRAFQREHPKEAAELEVIWETEPLVNNAVMVRDDLPAELVSRLRALLLGLPETPEGRAVLAGIETARFRPAADADYEIVRRYVARFELEVRPVERR